MQIQYSKKKQEMRRDPLVEALVSARHYLDERRQPITIATSVVLLAALGVALFSNIRTRGVARADEAFGKAVMLLSTGSRDAAIEELGAVANEYSGTPHAAYSAFVLGSELLKQQRYDEALAWFEDAQRNKRGSGFVGAAALEGISAANEGMGNFDAALEYGRKALADDRLAFRHPAIRWRLALIDRQLSDSRSASELCEEIVSDTLAVLYHQKARNMLAVLDAAR